jgi:hypothetical protein
MAESLAADYLAVHWKRILLVMAAIGILYTPGLSSEAKAPERLVVTVGKSLSIDSPVTIKRVAIANTNLAGTVMIGPKEVLVNGLVPGETLLIIWQEGDIRIACDVLVRPQRHKARRRKRPSRERFPASERGPDDRQRFRLRAGTVRYGRGGQDPGDGVDYRQGGEFAAVAIPPEEPQILLGMRFADVERGATTELSSALASGAFNTTGSAWHRIAHQH